MEYSPEHKAIIADFMAQDPSDYDWDKDSKIKPVKRFIKDSLIELQSGFCCYCQAFLDNDHRMVIDIEHILPKKREDFHRFIFEDENLAISCKRCNLSTCKGQKIDFLTSLDFGDSWNEASLYKFIHPRLEKLEEHIIRGEKQKGTQKAIYFKWDKDDSKASYHFGYFKLHELERSGFTDITRDEPTCTESESGASIFDELQEEDL